MIYLTKYHRPVMEFDAMTIEQKAATIAMIEKAIEAEEKAEKEAEKKARQSRKRGRH